jgi:hypothetical protein
MQVLVRRAPPRPSAVYDTYFRFAAARQEIYFRRLAGCVPPYCDDPILTRYRFTNAYRAADRVSQYLIRHVIYSGDPSCEEVFFRALLFKLFNRVETWELLQEALGTPRAADFAFARYDAVLTKAIDAGARLYSAAYVMPAASGLGHQRKHRNHLTLLGRMLADGVPRKLAGLPGLAALFTLLRGYYSIGDFLAYQFAIDLNYSALVGFDEDEFVIAGPGARDGIRKCFDSLGDHDEASVIRWVCDRQEQEFARRGLGFHSLFGRRLKLIDCQNLFCEVDKYARVAHPEVAGRSGRTRIKQCFRPGRPLPSPFFPPKWRLAPLDNTASLAPV